MHKSIFLLHLIALHFIHRVYGVCKAKELKISFPLLLREIIYIFFQHTIFEFSFSARVKEWKETNGKFLFFRQ